MVHKREVLMVIVALAAGLLGGTALTRIFPGQTVLPQQQSQQQEVIRAQRIELVDANGKARIVLGTESLDLGHGYEGPAPIMHGIGIFILNDEANPVAALGVNVDGAPILELHGQHGTVALAAGDSASIPYPHGPALMLENTTVGRALLRVEEQEAQLNLTSLSSSNKEAEIALTTEKDFGANLHLTFTDHSSESEKSVDLAANSLPYLIISSRKEFFSKDQADRSGKKELSKEEAIRRLIAHTHIGLGIESSGPNLSINDEHGALRTVLGTTQLKDPRTGSVETRSPSSLVLFGENGKVIWQAP